MRTASTIAGLIGAIAAAYGVTAEIDRRVESRVAQAEDLAYSCLPRAGETAIIISDGQRLHCRAYKSASTSPGMAPVLVSAAVVDTVVQP